MSEPILALSQKENTWSGPKIELNLSFDNLREYQWKRLLDTLWGSTGISGPFVERYHPFQPDPEPTPIVQPDPTATYSQFGAFELQAGVRVGIEVLVTRSLFECVSLLIPVAMFENVQLQVGDPCLNVVQNRLYDLSIGLYKIVSYDIASIGVDRGCELLMELVSDPRARERFMKQGNFLARDETLAAIRVEPKAYEEVMQKLRWIPAIS